MSTTKLFTNKCTTSIGIDSPLSKIREIASPTGLTVSYSLSKKIDFVICTAEEYSKNSQKIKQAIKLNIPIVKIEYLLECIKKNEVLPYDGYLLTTDVNQVGSKRLASLSLEDSAKKQKLEVSSEVNDLNKPNSSNSVHNKPRTAQKKWKEAKVFISSTFRDMHGERDYLSQIVFPELQERCNKIKVHVSFIDLRWGVTEEEAKNGTALEYCLKQVDECRPFFLGLLGNRYGWVPDQYHYSTNEFAWLKDYPAGKSVTHLEMYYGALHPTAAKNHRALIYIRDDKFLSDVPGSVAADFYPENSDSESNLADLKTQLIHANVVALKNYPCSWRGIINDKPMTGNLDVFGKSVVEQLWLQIKAQFPSTEVISLDPLQQAREYHEYFVEHNSRLFIGRKNLLATLKSPLKATCPIPPTVICGLPGSGKSSLVAAFTRQIQDEFSATHKIIPHFVGGAPGSTSIRNTLQRICEELNLYWDLKEEIPQEYVEIEEKFVNFLTKTPHTDKPVVIIIDAINQLDSTDRPWSVQWIPKDLAQGVHLYVSTLPGLYEDELKRKLATAAPYWLTVMPLDKDDCTAIVTERLMKFSKKLTPEQMRILLSKKDSSRPLYLTVACEELRVFGVFEKLTQRIVDFPNEIPKLFEQVLLRLETDYGKDLVQAFFALIASSRGGLTENELRDIIGGWDQPNIQNQQEIRPLSKDKWDILYRGTKEYLKTTGDQNQQPRIDFFHEQLLIAVRVNYLNNQQENLIEKRVGFDFAQLPLWRKAHYKLAEYFLILADPDNDKTFSGTCRALSELPYHLTQSKQWKLFVDTCCDLNFIEAKAAGGLTYDLLQDFIFLLSPSNQEHMLHQISYDKDECEQYVAKAKEFFWFLKARAYIIDRKPQLTFPAALSLPESSFACKAAVNKWNSGFEDRPHIRWENKPKQSDPCLMTLMGHSMVVPFCAVNPIPDSKMIASVGHDGTIKLWNSDTGELLTTILGHDKSINHCAFSSDGQQLVTSSWDKTVRVWNLNSFQETHRIGIHTSVVRCAVFSPRSERIFSVGQDKKLYTHNLRASVCESVMLEALSAQIYFCAISDSGLLFAVCGENGILCLYEVGGRQVLVRKTPEIPIPTKKAYNCCAFSKDGTLLVTAGEDRSVTLWEIHQSANQLTLQHKRTMLGHKDGVVCANFSSDGKRIVSVSHDNIIMIWDVETGEKLSWLLGHTGSVFSCTFSLDDQRIISSSFDRTVKIWEIPGAPDFDQHIGRILGVAYSKNGKQLVTASRDRTVKLWDTELGKLVHTFEGHQSNVFGCDFALSGNMIASASRDGTVKIWDPVSGRLITTLLHGKGQKIVYDCAFSPDSELLVSVGEDKTAILWNTRTWEKVATLYGHRLPILCVAFSPDGKKILTGSRDTTLKLWDRHTRRKLGTFCGHTHFVNCCAFSTDSKKIISGSDDSQVIEWSAVNGKRLYTLKGHTQPIKGCCYSSDGNHIFTTSTDSMVIVWDSETKREICYYGCLSRATCVASSSIGNKFAIGDGAGTWYSLCPTGFDKSEVLLV